MSEEKHAKNEVCEWVQKASIGIDIGLSLGYLRGWKAALKSVEKYGDYVTNEFTDKEVLERASHLLSALRAKASADIDQFRAAQRDKLPDEEAASC